LLNRRAASILECVDPERQGRVILAPFGPLSLLFLSKPALIPDDAMSCCRPPNSPIFPLVTLRVLTDPSDLYSVPRVVVRVLVYLAKPNTLLAFFPDDGQEADRAHSVRLWCLLLAFF